MSCYSLYNIEFWNDYENKIDVEKVGLALKTNQDTIKIFVFELDRSKLNSIVKYTTFIESVFMTGLNRGCFFDKLNRYKKLRVYFGDDNEDNLVNEFIIDKFVPYFRRNSLPLFYYEDFLTKEEKERNNISVENKINIIPFLVYWHEKEEDGDKYEMITVGITWDIDEENNQVLVHMNKNMDEIPENKRNSIKESIKNQFKEYGWDGEIKYE